MTNRFVRSAAAGAGTGADWTNAFTTLGAAFTGGVAGDTFWLADDHAQTQASALTLTCPGTTASPCFIYCVDHTVASPAAANLKSDQYTVSSPACGTITTTGFNSITVTGVAHWYGVVFNATSGAAATGSVIFNCPGSAVNCSFRKLGTGGTTNALSFGAASTLVLDNCTYQVGSTSDGVGINGAIIITNNSGVDSGVVHIGATLPTVAFRAVLTSAPALIQGINGSAITGTFISLPTSGSQLTVNVDRCLLAANVTFASVPVNTGSVANLITSDSTGAAIRQASTAYYGSMVHDTTVTRTGGASVNGTALSWLLTSNADAKWIIPYVLAFPLAVYNTVTGVDVTVTVYGVLNAAAVPNNDDIGIRAVYLGTSSSPIAGVKKSTKATNLASNAALTADSTSAWDSGVTARANTTAYSLGAIRKVATNPGRIFFCTTAGTSAGSEPAGYASAVDGGSVTDNTAVFRAACRFTMSVILTSPQPQLAGNITVTPEVYKASTGYYIDPNPVLS